MKTSLKMLEDRLTGSAERLRELYREAFSDMEADRLVAETKKQNRMIALAVLCVAALAVSVSASDGPAARGAALDLERPGAGEAPKSVEADVSAEYEGLMIRQRAELRILPREPYPVEAEKMLHELEGRLPGLILGSNASIGEIASDLSLPLTDAETGAELSWSSSDTRVISGDGSVNLVGAEAGAVVTLTARIRIGEAQDTFRVAVKMGAEAPPEQMEEALQGRLEEAVKAASSARDGEYAALPDMTDDGVSLSWAAPSRGSGFPAIFGCALIAFACFGSRYRAAARRICAARAEMEKDFPDFIQKLGLLLGAGMVITSAISRITEDYVKTREIYGRRRLYEELTVASEHMRAAGTPLVYEFSDIARRSGLREIMRFSSILSDNIDKGSTLADKLRAESELLWESRKKRAEKEGRVAETKLVFPMVLQILAVIAITVMPAAFEMG
ncbi:MAG: type II secretion system F family protein [Clostridiales Family XIII bacterium]|jgi:hypothetical protein|nr:type II secretion system F family protein [Clostridiales Family XIII bacterium]